MKKRFIPGILLFALLIGSAISVKAQRHPVKKEHRHYANKRYAKLPPWGFSYHALPNKANGIAHKGLKFYYYQGIFYKPLQGNFVIAKAPIGIKISTLPAGKIKFSKQGKNYYYYYGTFYLASPDGKEFTTINPPVGARVDALPEGYKELQKSGALFYEFEGTIYKPVLNENGEEWYQVVESN